MLIRARGQATARLRSGALVFVVALLAVLPQGMLQGYSEYSMVGIISRTFSPPAYSSFVISMTIIGIAMDPVLLFVLMYMIGRRLDLKRKYAAVAFYLFIGALMGGFLGRATVYLASPASSNVLTIVVSIGVESITSAISAVFAGFSAVAFAYIRRLSTQDGKTPNDGSTIVKTAYEGRSCVERNIGPER